MFRSSFVSSVTAFAPKGDKEVGSFLMRAASTSTLEGEKQKQQ